MDRGGHSVSDFLLDLHTSIYPVSGMISSHSLFVITFV